MRIIWSSRAKKELADLAQYLAEEFGNSSVERLIHDVQICSKRLSEYPEIGRPEPLLQDKSIAYRSLIFTHHNKLIYYLKGEDVRIADIWDMRRNPEVLAKRIRTK